MKAGPVVGSELFALEVVSEVSEPLRKTLDKLNSSFSNRLLWPRCLKEQEIIPSWCCQTLQGPLHDTEITRFKLLLLSILHLMFHLSFLFDISILFYSYLSSYCMTFYRTVYSTINVSFFALVFWLHLYLPVYLISVTSYQIHQADSVKFLLIRWLLVFFFSVDQIKNILQSWFVVYCRLFPSCYAITMTTHWKGQG